MKPFKIAPCLSGALKYDYCENLGHTVKNVATPLNADIFLLSWNEAYLRVGTGGLGVGFLRNLIDEKLLRNAPNELLIGNYHFSELFPNIFSLVEQEYAAKIPKKNLNTIRNFTSFKALALENVGFFMQNYPRVSLIHDSSRMFYGWDRVLNLLFEYERRMKERHDFITMFHPDKRYTLNSSLDELKNLKTKDLVIETSSDEKQLGDVYAFGRRFIMVEFLSAFAKASGGVNEEFFEHFPCGINCASYGCLDHVVLRRYVDFIGLNVIEGQNYVE